MSKYLRKSWKVNPKTEYDSEESLSDKFEREVMRNAKGSIATVLRNPAPAARNPARDRSGSSEHSPAHEKSDPTKSKPA